MRSLSIVLCLSGLIAAALVPSVAAAAPASPSYKVIKRLSLGGKGGWDYLSVDAQRHHLFVSRGDRVLVIDTRTDKQVGTIGHTPGVHGVAVAQDLRRGFVSNGKDDSVTVFDLDSLKTVGVIHGTGHNPDAIAYDPGSHHVFTFNGRSASASVIDPAKMAVIDTIALPGKPEFAVSDGAGHMFVNIEDKSELVEFGVATDKVMNTWSLAPCASPSGLAMDVSHQRLFSVCENETMAVTDAQTGKQVATVPIGKGPDAVVFDAARSMIFSSNGESGTITAIHEDSPDHYSVAATIPTQVSARTMTLDPRSQRLYLSAARPGPTKNARGWPMMIPGSYSVLVVGQQ